MKPFRTAAAAAALAFAAGPALAFGPDSPIPTAMSAGGAEWPTPEPPTTASPDIDRPAPLPGDGTRGSGPWTTGRPTITFDLPTFRDAPSGAAPAGAPAK